jgi:hypothetical protein
MHFETALGQAGAQLAALRQWRNGNLAHYAEFLWHIYAEPKAYDANLSRWCAAGACGGACVCCARARVFAR